MAEVISLVRKNSVADKSGIKSDEMLISIDDNTIENN